MVLTCPLFRTFPNEKCITEKTNHKYLDTYNDLNLYEILGFYVWASIFLRYLNT